MDLEPDMAVGHDQALLHTPEGFQLEPSVQPSQQVPAESQVIPSPASLQRMEVVDNKGFSLAVVENTWKVCKSIAKTEGMLDGMRRGAKRAEEELRAVYGLDDEDDEGDEEEEEADEADAVADDEKAERSPSPDRMLSVGALHSAQDVHDADVNNEYYPPDNSKAAIFIKQQQQRRVEQHAREQSSRHRASVDVGPEARHGYEDGQDGNLRNDGEASSDDGGSTDASQEARALRIFEMRERMRDDPYAQ